MRKKCILLLVLLLLLGSILVCSAEEFVDEFYIEHVPYDIDPHIYDDYEEFCLIHAKKPRGGFVYCEQLSFLGIFLNGECANVHRDFIYRLDSGDCQISFYTNHNWWPEKGAILHGWKPNEWPTTEMYGPQDTPIESSGEQDLRRYDWAHRQYVTINNAEYHYFNQELCFIVLYIGEFTYYLEGDFGNYPVENAVNEFIPRLLNAETAPAALDEIYARIQPVINPEPPEPTPAWVLPTAICGGAVVLAAAVAVPTVILRRKKRKAAAAGDGAADADAPVPAPAPDEGEDTPA